ncbi:unnamed protein product [Arctia plantaginis]|uniref:Tectonic domain-containing protein n=1 Tax=Arctia plantaginis TaxID=874455 RepID=A0A8S1APB8_ARCPL|nr:unnamed protein product [Arctia plantaginis]
MDFIQEKIEIKKNPKKVNSTTQKRIVEEFLLNITNKPHALYYRTITNKNLEKPAPIRNKLSEMNYSNSSVPTVPSGTTDISTTVFDVLYDESTSITETAQTTESFYTSTEFDNITEITFFEASNKTSLIPNNVPKTNYKKYCGCNLLFEVCDINCCCDPECSNDELKQFECDKNNNDDLSTDGCVSHLLHGALRWSSSLNNLFCVVKTNLPHKRNIQKPKLELANHHNKWKDVDQHQKTYEFKKLLYKQTDPIWLLRNGTLYYFDVPTPMVNNYCTDRAPIGFLYEEKITCIVKFNDLEMFYIGKTESSMVISATERTMNSTVLNCSNLHCINWTILACYNNICKNYNKTLDAPSCTESNCTNVSFKIDYNFYYYDFKITNATIKLHIQKVLYNVLPLMSQEITVKFIMANKSLDYVIKFSGNPGYINNLQLIFSNAKSNFTDRYFNNTPTGNYWILPDNQNGLCILTNMSENFIRFNLNKRTKCRYVYTHQISKKNDTSACKAIQDDISALLGLNREVLIAPFGNPYAVKDEDWIKMQTNILSPVYGEYSNQTFKLHCYNLVHRVSFLFVFASVEKNFVGQNKILSAKYEALPINRSFNVEDISMVLTIDINFIDASTPNLYVYASSPYLSIHLPKDFFFPFPPNSVSHLSNLHIVAILCNIITLFK